MTLFTDEKGIPSGTISYRSTRPAVVLTISGFTLDTSRLLVQAKNLRAILLTLCTTYAMAPLLAYALALTLGVLAWRFRGRGHLGHLSLAAAVVVLIQIVLGVLNVLWDVPVEITALHSAGAASLVLILAALFHEVSRRTREGADGHPRHETA